MRYLSLCSGIEAASVAWRCIDWKPAGFAEIEAFPSAVLKHRFPGVRNYGDMTKFKEWKDVGTVDVMVGGTPCQSFSVAGLRKGLNDPRGNLMLTFGAIANHFRPRWIIWENVPGVLSSNKGRDFGAFLGMLAECGYGFAYRVLDAQYFGVAQRRRRVFVVGHLGDWRRAAAVLFESESLSGNPPPSRKKGEGVANGVEIGPGGGHFTEVSATLDTKCKDGPVRNQVGMAICAPLTIAAEVAPCLTASGRGVERIGETRGQDPVVACYGIPGNWINRKPENGGNATQPMGDTAPCLTGMDRHAVAVIPIDLRNATRNPEQMESGVGIGKDGDPAGTITTGKVGAVCLMDQGGQIMNVEHDKTGTLRAQMGGHVPIVYDCRGVGDGKTAPTLCTDQAAKVGDYCPIVIDGQGGEGMSNITIENISPTLCKGAVLRRLTPIECERLQGFPDNWTRIPYRGKPVEQCPDSPRYKACGNSMAVPVMRWIGERIEKVEKGLTE